MIKIRPKDLKLVEEILAKYVPQSEVWAYGSRVDGTAHDTSDLDLVIRNPQDLSQPNSNIGSLREAFVKSSLPIIVDVHDWAQIPKSFRQEINACHHILQQAK